MAEPEKDDVPEWVREASEEERKAAERWSERDGAI
jgi:hypothetical protein